MAKSITPFLMFEGVDAARQRWLQQKLPGWTIVSAAEGQFNLPA
jgi:hypothetical protein